MMYQTFKRSATNWEQFGRGRKITVDTHLSIEQAREQCKAFNDSRTRSQIRRGTFLEFEAM